MIDWPALALAAGIVAGTLALFVVAFLWVRFCAESTANEWLGLAMAVAPFALAVVAAIYFSITGATQ